MYYMIIEGRPMSTSSLRTKKKWIGEIPPKLKSYPHKVALALTKAPRRNIRMGGHEKSIGCVCEYA